MLSAIRSGVEFLAQSEAEWTVGENHGRSCEKNP